MDQPRRLLFRAAGLVVGRFIVVLALCCGALYAFLFAVDMLRRWLAS